MKASHKLAIATAALLGASGAQAHTLLIACHPAAAGQVSCKGSYSDGEAAAGGQVRVVTEADKVLKTGAANKAGVFTFAKPAVPYHVVLRTGAHHITNLSSVDVK